MIVIHFFSIIHIFHDFKSNIISHLNMGSDKFKMCIEDFLFMIDNLLD